MKLWRLLMAAVLVFATCAVTVSASGATVDPEVWIGSPFTGHWASSDDCPPPKGVVFSYACSEPAYHSVDYYAVDGTPRLQSWAADIGGPPVVVGTKVYLFAAPQVPGTPITAKVDKVGAACAAPNSAGQVVVIGLYSGSTKIGTVAYAHVVVDPGLPAVGQTINRWGGLIGTVGGNYTHGGTCWSGVHLHVEMGNVHNFSCYNGGFHFGHPWGDPISPTNFIGMIGGQRTPGSRQPCPSAPVITHYTDPTGIKPAVIAAGSDGALWFTENNDSIGRVTTTGVMTHFTDPSISGAPQGIAAGPDGALWFTNSNSIGRITTAGKVTHYSDPSIEFPWGITAGPDGALWFANFDNASVGRITTAGKITHFSDPSINGPVGITVGRDGALWFTNFTGNSIGRITTTGRITHYTGAGIVYPAGITVGNDGALWFANFGSHSIGRITTTGTVTNYTDPSISGPSWIAAGNDGALWFTNDSNNSIGRITTAGTITHYTGVGINGPYGITAGSDGAMWFTNSNTNSIGRITTH